MKNFNRKLQRSLLKAKFSYYLGGFWNFFFFLLFLSNLIFFGYLIIIFSKQKITWQQFGGFCLGITSIIFAYGVYIKLLQSKIYSESQKIEHLQKKCQFEFLFYLLLKNYFIYAYLGYLLFPGEKIPNELDKDHIFSQKTLAYFNHFRQKDEDWHQFFKRVFGKWDPDLLKKHIKFIKLLRSYDAKNNYKENLFFTLQNFILEMKINAYKKEWFFILKKTEFLEGLDFFWIDSLIFLKFNALEEEITKFKHKHFGKDSPYSKHWNELWEIKSYLLQVLKHLDFSWSFLKFDLIEIKKQKEEANRIKQNVLESREKIFSIGSKMLAYSESEFGSTTHNSLIRDEDL